MLDYTTAPAVSGAPTFSSDGLWHKYVTGRAYSLISGLPEPVQSLPGHYAAYSDDVVRVEGGGSLFDTDTHIRSLGSMPADESLLRITSNTALFFDPNEARGHDGKWTGSGKGKAQQAESKAKKSAAEQAAAAQAALDLQAKADQIKKKSDAAANVAHAKAAAAKKKAHEIAQAKGQTVVQTGNKKVSLEMSAAAKHDLYAAPGGKPAPGPTPEELAVSIGITHKTDPLTILPSGYALAWYEQNVPISEKMYQELLDNWQAGGENKPTLDQMKQGAAYKENSAIALSVALDPDPQALADSLNAQLQKYQESGINNLTVEDLKMTLGIIAAVHHIKPSPPTPAVAPHANAQQKAGQKAATAFLVSLGIDPKTPHIKDAITKAANTIGKEYQAAYKDFNSYDADNLNNPTPEYLAARARLDKTTEASMNLDNLDALASDPHPTSLAQNFLVDLNNAKGNGASETFYMTKLGLIEAIHGIDVFYLSQPGEPTAADPTSKKPLPAQGEPVHPELPKEPNYKEGDQQILPGFVDAMGNVTDPGRYDPAGVTFQEYFDESPILSAYAGWAQHVTADQGSTISEYMGSAYRPLNDWLREGSKPEKFDRAAALNNYNISYDEDLWDNYYRQEALDRIVADIAEESPDKIAPQKIGEFDVDYMVRSDAYATDHADEVTPLLDAAQEAFMQQKQDEYLATAEENFNSSDDSHGHEVEDMRDQLDAAFALPGAVAPENMLLWRRGYLQDEEGKDLNEFDYNEILKDDGFVSTSLAIDTANNFNGQLFAIEVPKGLPAIYLNKISHGGENEMLLPRGSKFVRVGDFMAKGSRYMPGSGPIPRVRYLGPNYNPDDPHSTPISEVAPQEETDPYAEWRGQGMTEGQMEAARIEKENGTYYGTTLALLNPAPKEPLDWQGKPMKKPAAFSARLTLQGNPLGTKDRDSYDRFTWKAGDLKKTGQRVTPLQDRGAFSVVRITPANMALFFDTTQERGFHGRWIDEGKGRAGGAGTATAVAERPERITSNTQAPAAKPQAKLTADVAMARQEGAGAGSNVGGFYKGTDNVDRYVKTYDDPTQAQGEALANDIYRALGLNAPNSQTFKKGEKTLFASDIVPGSSRASQIGEGLDKDQANRILDGFAADVLMANWDVLGMGMDNVLDVGGEVHRVDNGSAFLHRAQGTRKPEGLLDSPSEWESLAPGGRNTNYANVFETAGYKGPDDMGERIQNQLVAIQKLRDSLPDGWAGFVQQHAPDMSPEDQGRISRMLESRTKGLAAHRNLGKTASFYAATQVRGFHGRWIDEGKGRVKTSRMAEASTTATAVTAAPEPTSTAATPAEPKGKTYGKLDVTGGLRATIDRYKKEGLPSGPSEAMPVGEGVIWTKVVGELRAEGETARMEAIRTVLEPSGTPAKKAATTKSPAKKPPAYTTGEAATTLGEVPSGPSATLSGDEWKRWNAIVAVLEKSSEPYAAARLAEINAVLHGPPAEKPKKKARIDPELPVASMAEPATDEEMANPMKAGLTGADDVSISGKQAVYMVGGFPSEAARKASLRAPFIGAEAAELMDRNLLDGYGEWEAMASFLNRNVSDLLVRAERRLRRLTADARIVKSTHAETLKKILADGYIKTQFESGTSSGSYFPDSRKSAELELFGHDPGEAAADRPVYGYMTSDPNRPGALDSGGYGSLYGDGGVYGYGDVDIVFKDERVRSRSTMVGTDSLGLSGGRYEATPAPVSDPNLRAIGGSSGILSANRLEEQGDPYMEAQIHGRVTTEDIDYVVLPDNGTPAALGTLLDEKGIRWELRKHGPSYSPRSEE